MTAFRASVCSYDSVVFEVDFIPPTPTKMSKLISKM